ncbi:AraC family transcriptional regulator [Clostridium sp. 29_15]|uniref:AraC family transcriptional regulator n=1 Tax=Clostridium sp. 29_15 TaxID=1896982 RepID=UPI000958F7C9|nr:helix-turn-helix domain-containing protein [Clostridium sp. 29_15]OKZ87788.1 MAG: AraC family transcriptional regulator [Clostridium sp. 29_15]
MFSYDFTPKDNNIFEDNKQPKLLRLCHNFNNPGWVYNYHLHKNATEIVYIANGKAEYTVDMNTFTLEKGQILIMEKGVLHSITSDKDYPADAWTCIIGNYKITYNTEDVMLLPNKTFHIMNAGIHEDFIKNTFKEIYNLCLNNNSISHGVCDILATSLTSTLYHLIPHEEESSENNHSSFIRDVLVYISEHYTEKITLKKLSEVFHISTGHISHSFTKEYGVSPINYAIDLRICDAKLMLINSTESLVSIARKVGYDNPTHFTNIFTNRVNCSPTEYREFHNKKNNYNFVDDSSTSCININIDNSLKEVHELKKDFEKIKEENEILQKAMSILARKN